MDSTITKATVRDLWMVSGYTDKDGASSCAMTTHSAPSCEGACIPTAKAVSFSGVAKRVSRGAVAGRIESAMRTRIHSMGDICSATEMSGLIRTSVGRYI